MVFWSILDGFQGILLLGDFRSFYDVLVDLGRLDIMVLQSSYRRAPPE